MKNGIFKLRIGIFVVALIQLSGCASLLGNFTEADNPADRDRGYAADQANNPEEDDSACTGRFCRSIQAEQELGRAPASDDPLQAVKRAIASRDVVLGMSRQDVAESWGEPLQREVAGAGGFGNERWTYGSRYSLNGSRTIIFENGRVSGWYR